MVKTLSKHGNSLALILDRPVLDLLNIDENTPLEITTDGDGLVIRPVRKKTHRARVRQAAKRVMDAHQKTLRNLAE
ncbi:MAG: AbrB/MazE/SpoVT family DNA-binding domain-containing protein [Deltaproteobacteria bacterium]|nr:AbrB/MazE/SpoVT family DNA-binding domain-containing protein [Deltaproteobacteria bacterium]